MKDQFGNDVNRPVGLRFWKRPLTNRRMFFRHAASAVGGYMLLPSLQEKAKAQSTMTPVGTAKNVIFVLMTGAPAHIDTFDLKVGPWTPSFMAPTTFNGMAFPQGLMPNLANTIGDIALVRSIRAHATAHSLAQTWVQIGRNPIQGLNNIAPHIGSVVSLELGDPNATLAAVHFAECSERPEQWISSAIGRAVLRQPQRRWTLEYIASGRTDSLQSPLRPDDATGCGHDHE